MILSRGRSYVFIHIPKTGGTALSLALEARAMAGDQMLGDTPKALRRRRRVQKIKSHGRLWKHSTLADIEGLASREDLRGHFAFTLVRNPYDRVVSYFHWLRAQRFAHPVVTLAKNLSFQSFVCNPHVVASLRANPYTSYMLQSNGQEHCDLYIRLETFAADAQPLFDHLGFSFELSRVNESSRCRDWRKYYTEQAFDAVSRACSDDIRQFEYSFNEFPLSL